MLKVWSDVLLAADRRQVTLLGLLDLSAAFDCADHDLLLQRLEANVGLMDTALAWFGSIIRGRAQQVSYGGQLSPIESVL